MRPAPGPARRILIALVMASNIGGTATLIGDPPNLIIASRGDLSFNDFLIHLTPFIAVAFVAFVLLSRWLFRESFSYDPARVEAIMRIDERRAIRDQPFCVAAWQCSLWSFSGSFSARPSMSRRAWWPCSAPACSSWCPGRQPPTTWQRSSGRP